MAWEPVVYFETDKPLGKMQPVGWRGAGWYFRDPADANVTDDFWAVQGPYATKEFALAEYRAYCECMTI